MKLEDFFKEAVVERDRGLWCSSSLHMATGENLSETEKRVKREIYLAENAPGNTSALSTDFENAYSSAVLSHQTLLLAELYFYALPDSTVLCINCDSAAFVAKLKTKFKVVLVVHEKPAMAYFSWLNCRNYDNVFVVAASVAELREVRVFDHIIEFPPVLTSRRRISSSKVGTIRLLKSGGTVCEILPLLGAEDFGAKTVRKHSVNFTVDTDTYLLFGGLASAKALLRSDFLNEYYCDELIASFEEDSVDTEETCDGAAAGAPRLLAPSHEIKFTRVYDVEKESDSFIGAFLGSTQRKRKYIAVSRIEKSTAGDVVLKKRRFFSESDSSDRWVAFRSFASSWQDGKSLQARLSQSNSFFFTTDEIQLIEIWLETLRSEAIVEDLAGAVSGKYIDAIWQNSFIEGNNCQFIDLEWEWLRPISIDYLMIRAIYRYLDKVRFVVDECEENMKKSLQRIITDISIDAGIELRRRDFYEFVMTESRFIACVSGRNRLLVICRLIVNLSLSTATFLKLFRLFSKY